MIYAQINSITHVIEQFVAFNEGLDQSHVAANPQAYFVESLEMGNRKTHEFNLEHMEVVRKPLVERVVGRSWDEKRRREYPPINEQLDAIWKGGQEMAAMKAKIDAVKAKYPKP